MSPNYPNMIKLTHATWKEDDGSDIEVFICRDHVFSVFYMPSNKATAVLSIGGGHVIVKESVKQVLEILTNKETVNNGME
jgi:hypothetical protein